MTIVYNIIVVVVDNVKYGFTRVGDRPKALVRLELCAMSDIHTSNGYPLDTIYTSGEGVVDTFLAA